MIHYDACTHTRTYMEVFIVQTHPRFHIRTHISLSHRDTHAHNEIQWSAIFVLRAHKLTHAQLQGEGTYLNAK